jgi:hypothetical protein
MGGTAVLPSRHWNEVDRSVRWNCAGAASSHYIFDTGGDSTELYCANDYYRAFANEPAYVHTNLTIGQVETLWNLP